MPILGAHESIAGGYYKAVEIAARVGCDCVQVFTNGLQANKDGQLIVCGTMCGYVDAGLLQGAQ